MSKKRSNEIENVFFYGEKIINDEKFEKIKDFIDNSGIVESQPQIAKKIVDLSNNEETSISDIEKVVSSDPVIAAKILKMANSSFYKLSREVSSIKRAILILGIAMIKDIALSIAILDMFKDKAKGILNKVWQHSVATSIGSKLLSINFSEDIDSDVCFTAGLLHDIGKILLAKHDGYEKVFDVMKQGDEKKANDLEDQIFGFNHSEIGTVLANIWEFSPEMNYIIYNHHNIEKIIKVDKESLSVPYQYVWNTAIVSLADKCSHVLGIAGHNHPVESISIESLQFLGYESHEHIQTSFLDEFKETFESEKSLFD